jgi:hypothetical protein
MNIAKRPPVFLFGRRDGVCQMSELWRAAFFIADQMNHEVVVEGVTHVSQTARGTKIDAPPVSNTNRSAGLNVLPKKAQYRFKRRSGVVLNREFIEYVAWLNEQLGLQIESNDLIGGNNAGGTSHVAFKMNPDLL